MEMVESVRPDRVAYDSVGGEPAEDGRNNKCKEGSVFALG